MEEFDALDFTDKIFREMKRHDSVMSIANVKLFYKSIYGEDVSDDYIKSLLLEDKRFIFANKSCFLLTETLNKIKLKYKGDIGRMEKVIKDRYFVEEIDKEVLINSNSEKNLGASESVIFKFEDRIYEINSENDFYDVIIKEGAITYDGINTISEYLGKDYHLFAAELEEIGINICSKEEIRENCIVYKKKIHPKPTYNVVSKYDVFNNNENILLIDLHTNEIIACLLAIFSCQLYYREIKKSYFSNRHLSNLYKLNIIYDFDSSENIILTEFGEKVINDFERYINDNYYVNEVISKTFDYSSIKELAKSKILKKIDCKKMWHSIGEAFRLLYFHNYYANKLINLIEVGNRQGLESLGDIIIFHLIKGNYQDIREIFVGEKATSGRKPIRDNKDICFDCKGYRCSKGIIISKNKLIYYRDYYVDNIIRRINKNINYVDKLRTDPLIIKFIVPYNLISKNKKIMQNIKLISGKKILHKKDGKYCPFKDKWILMEEKND